MYPVAYTWIRNPTPVTTRIITADSASSENPHVISSASPCDPTPPSGSHVPSASVVKCRSSEGSDASPRTAPAERRNASSTAPHAIHPTARFERRTPTIPLIADPAIGSSGISQIFSRKNCIVPLPLQERDLVDVDRLLQAEQCDRDREADRGLRGGERHHEEDVDLSLGSAPLPGERQEREVPRVQHQLDAHQDRDRPAAEEDPHDPDREEECGEDEQEAGIHHVRSSSSRGAPPR